MSDSPTTGMPISLYARVSTEEQREGQTIDSQLAELDRFAREKGWHIVDTYKDNGWSGGLMDRPELDRLRDDARRHLFQAVLINDVDRLARDVAHLGVIKKDLEKQGVQIVFRKLPAEASPTYNLMVNILGSFAEFERELIIDRTRRGRRYKVEVRKEYLGSNTAYGYRYTPKERAAGNQGLLEIVPEEAAVVRQMFRWVDEDGLSARRVITCLNRVGARPRKSAQGWARSSVLRILRNEMYAGVWYYNKFQLCEPKRRLAKTPRYQQHAKSSVRRRPRAEWLPVVLPEALRIVPRDQWLRVQRQLDRNRAFSPRNSKHFYLLSGLVRCGACHSRYVGNPYHGRFYYRCMGRCKRYPAVQEGILDKVILDKVTEVIQNPALILEQIARLNESERTTALQAQAEVAELQALSNTVQMEEDRIFEVYRRGTISPAQLGQQLEQIKVRRAAIDVRRSALARPEPVPQDEQVQRSLAEYCKEVARNLTGFTPDEYREFLRTIIREIVFQGSVVRIQGELSLPDYSAPEIESNEDLMRRKIETARPGHRGHNPPAPMHFSFAAPISSRVRDSARNGSHGTCC